MKRRRKRKRRILKTIMLLCTLAVIFSAFVCLKMKQEEEKIPFTPVEIQEVTLEQKYYYNQLAQEERTAYKEILQGVQEEKKEIYVHSGDAKRTNALFQYVLKDFPDIFWCDGSATTTAYEKGEAYTVLEPKYLCEGEEKERKQTEIENVAAECLAGVSQDASDYEKILYVYEYIVNTVDYDAQAEDNQNIYSVFVHKRSVCAGYSKATQYLLERMGVFCTYVTGTAGNGASHAWNLVQCEGDYYYVDTTWGDPLFQEKEDNISYDYMCCDDTQLFRTHTPDDDTELPACTQMEWYYYVVNGMYYESYDSEEALKIMNQDIAGGKSQTVFKYADDTAYQAAAEDIFGDPLSRAVKNLARQYGLSKVHYQYLNDETVNKIIIYWEYS